MAIAFVQAAQPAPTASDASPLSVAYASSNTAGNFLVVCGNLNGTGTLSVSDTAGNSYTAVNSPKTQSPLLSYMWIVPGCLGGANTVTISKSGSGYAELGILEYSGIATSSPTDVFTSNSAGSGTAITSGTTSATSDAVELVLVLITANNGGVGLPAGYTNRVGGDSYFKVNELVTSSSGTQSASTTCNDSVWTAQIATFKTPGSSAASQKLQLLGVG